MWSIFLLNPSLIKLPLSWTLSKLNRFSWTIEFKLEGIHCFLFRGLVKFSNILTAVFLDTLMKLFIYFWKNRQMSLTKFKFDWTCTNAKVKVEFFKNMEHFLYQLFSKFIRKIIWNKKVIKIYLSGEIYNFSESLNSIF